MGRLVVVSNRVADPRKSAAGGLAVALGQALEATGGLWLGWSGKIAEEGAGGASKTDAPLQMQRSGKVQLATFDLSASQHDRYYLGYSNGVLWPVCHYRLDLADFDAGYFDGYVEVNKLFASQLMPLLKSDDMVWIHDYHLIPLAAELRALGCQQRMGFFLHIPLPPPPMLAAIPQHAWLMERMCAYDVVGFQSQQDVGHFAGYAQQELGAQKIAASRVAAPNGAAQDAGAYTANGQNLPAQEQGAQHFTAFGRQVQVQAFPIGIDVAEFTQLAQGKDAREAYTTTREQYAHRRLLIGIDRLDYSKGIPHRIRAFRQLLNQFPENKDSATLIQIASPSRETVNAYTDILHELEGLCGAINGDFGNLGWMPVRYIHRTVARKRLPGLCRAARVGLVTPLRDGMNLVAKEFIAAQDSQDPGVLVLSRFAGAAEQLKEALLVNPYDTHGTAQAIQRALHMPLDERQERHNLLLARIKEHDVHWWSQSFLKALAAF
jgi:trehalose 6-phosphate synthase